MSDSAFPFRAGHPPRFTGLLPIAEVLSVADLRFAVRRRRDGGYTPAPGHFQEAFIGLDAFRQLRVFLPRVCENISGTRLLCRPPQGITSTPGPHPGIGRVVADLVAGRAPGHDLTRFRLSRFTDGSPIEIGPAL